MAAPVRSANELTAGAELRNYCSRVITERISAPGALWRMVRRLPTAAPTSMGYFDSPGFAAQIAAELRQTRFDLIFAHCAFVARYVSHVTSAK